MKYLLLFFVPFMVSCNASFGEKYIVGNLEIYYDESVNFKYAERLGEYFERNDLIQDKTHSVQLTSDPMGAENPGYVLKMILNREHEELPNEQTSNLELLEAEIRSEVFDDLNFRIDVCDDNFVSIKEEN